LPGPMKTLLDSNGDTTFPRAPGWRWRCYFIAPNGDQMLYEWDGSTLAKAVLPSDSPKLMSDYVSPSIRNWLAFWRRHLGSK
jgi:hypothetical protein